jgi:uncharacterized protein (TIGR00730 family)
MIKRICVFCGSNKGVNDEYAVAARELGLLMAKKGLGLIYGGGKEGMMGELSNSAIKNGGRVTGVIPKDIFSERAVNRDVTELKVTSSMHERKALMSALSDAVIVMPGGIGTLEEFAEVFTWIQLGLQTKPLGLLNTKGYYDSLLGFFDTAVKEGFFDKTSYSRLIVSDSPSDLLERILNHTKK